MTSLGGKSDAVKASAKKTPQPTPTSGPRLEEHDVTETKARLTGLREKCLGRDHHRYVISRVFELSEARACARRNHFLYEETKNPELLQVAHIIPHCLMSSGGQLDSKSNARKILDMFDWVVLRLIRRCLY